MKVRLLFYSVLQRRLWQSWPQLAHINKAPWPSTPGLRCRNAKASHHELLRRLAQCQNARMLRIPSPHTLIQMAREILAYGFTFLTSAIRFMDSLNTSSSAAECCYTGQRDLLMSDSVSGRCSGFICCTDFVRIRFVRIRCVLDLITAH